MNPAPFLALSLAAAAFADSTALVALTKDGAVVALSESERAQIARRVSVLIVGCAINSVTEPETFSAHVLPKEWEDTRAGSHLYVRFSTPLRSRRGGVELSEVVIGLQDRSFIGPELSRHGNRVVGHVKCDGHRALALMCATAVRPLLLPGQSKTCEVYDRIGEPQETP